MRRSTRSDTLSASRRDRHGSRDLISRTRARRMLFESLEQRTLLSVTPVYVDDGYTSATPGWGVDHFANIQDGIDAVSDSGSVVVAAGAYTDPINIEGRSNVAIDGEGRDSVILQPTTALTANVGGMETWHKAAIRVVNSTGITLQGITLDMNLAKGNDVVSVLWWDSTGTIQNNAFRNNWVSDTIDAYLEQGIYADAPSYTDGSRADLTVSGNQFVDMGRTGVITDGYVAATITDNVFTKSVDDFGFGIELGAASTGIIANNIVSGYHTAASDGSNSAGIYIENSFTSGVASAVNKVVTLTGNEVSDCQYGLWVGNESGFEAGNVAIQCTASLNYIHDNTEGGVLLAAGDASVGSSLTAHFQNNRVENNGPVGYFVFTAGDGVITASLEGEIITGNGVGVYLNDYALSSPSTSSYDLSIHDSTLEGNGVPAVQIDYSGASLDASGNWWGDNTPAGVASRVSGNVDYTPWLDTGTDSDANPNNGFQGQFDVLHVGAASPQTGTLGRIQEGIDLVNSGGTVNVHAGVYPGNVDGTAKAVTLSAGASPGQVTVDGNLTLGSSDTLPMELNGLSPGSGYDQWVVDGTVTLGGATLSVTRGFSPASGDSFVLIHNNGASSVIGTFAGLPEGQLLDIGGQTFGISYIDGADHHDVVLRRTDTGLNITAADAVKPELNSGYTHYTFTVTRGGVTSGTTTVKYAVTGWGTNPANKADYGGWWPHGSVTFHRGESVKTIRIDVHRDRALEADEEFTVTLSSASRGATIVTATANGTIINDDTGLAIAAADAVKAEGNTGLAPFTFTVTRSGVTTGETTVHYAVTGSGAHPARAADFGGKLPGGTVVFLAGETVHTLTLNVAGNLVVEPDEGFKVTLSKASGGAQITTAAAHGTILNDDIGLAIVAANAVKREGDGGLAPFTFTVTRAGLTTGVTTVQYAVTGGGTHPADADDFGGTLPSGVITFDVGESRKTLTIYVTGDAVIEPDEVFIVTLSGASGTSQITTATAVGKILNDRTWWFYGNHGGGSSESSATQSEHPIGPVVDEAIRLLTEST